MKKKTTLQYIQEINEKTKYFISDFEMANPANPLVDEPSSQQQEQEIVMDLMNKREIIENRRKELENIHKTASIVKDTTEQMVQNLNHKKEQLEVFEDNVITLKENVEKAQKEIVKVDEGSTDNTIKMLFLIFLFSLQ